MIHADDVTEPLEKLRWIEYQVRVLVPDAAIEAPASETMTERYVRLTGTAVDVDVTSTMYLGRGGACPTCGQVMIVIPPEYPWGRARYRGRETYCPHCDGGEDVG